LTGKKANLERIAGTAWMDAVMWRQCDARHVRGMLAAVGDALSQVPEALSTTAAEKLLGQAGQSRACPRSGESTPLALW
jgi:hypothetical protein